jgi:type II secretory pathway pseudopilin PulG
MTLLEVVIGLAILASLSLAVTLAFVPVTRQARANREVALANAEAKRVLEKVQAVEFKKITTIFPNGMETPIASLPNGKVLTTYEDPTSDPLVMRVTLTWDSPNLGPMLRTFFTLRTE